MHVAKTRVKLQRRYSRKMLRNIWRAYRTEYMNIPGGRHKVADFIEEKIIELQEHSDVVLDDGSEFVYEGNPPSAKTLYNFFSTSSQLFAPGTIDEAKENPIKTAIFTIQYIHLFLWSVHPERVASWGALENGKLEILPVTGVDESFTLFKLDEFFDAPVKIFVGTKTPKALEAVSKSITNSYTDGRVHSVEASAKHWKEMGIIAFHNSTTDVVCRFTYFDGAHWARLLRQAKSNDVSSDASPKHYSDGVTAISGTAVGFRTKDFVEKSSGSPPFIDNEATKFVMSGLSRATLKAEYLYISSRSPEVPQEFISKDLKMTMNHARRIEFKRSDSYESAVLGYASATEEEIFEYYSNFSK